MVDKLVKETQVVMSFDYAVLAPDQRTIIQQRTGEIRERLQRSAQDIWEIGQRLADVRARLKHGQFDAWLKTEFNWSRRTAYNFIRVYEAFQERANLAQIDIATSALYLLAAPSTSKDIRDDFLKRAKSGDKISHKEILEVIKANRSQPTDSLSNIPSPSTTTKPEVVNVISQVVMETTWDTPSELPSVTISGEKNTELQPGWYLLNQKHLLFCGDTASPQFFEHTPHVAFALAITSNDWDHDWIIEKADTLIVLQESALEENLIMQLISIFSKEEEFIMFPWLPLDQLIMAAHSLNRRVCAGDPSPEKCLKAIARAGLTAERINK